MKYISIDTETTGLDPKTSELLEVGLVVFESTQPFQHTSSNTLRVVFVRSQIQGNIFAIDMNKELLSEMLSIKFEHDEPYLEVLEEDCTTLYVNSDRIKKTFDFLDSDLCSVNSSLEHYLISFLADAGVEGKLNVAGKNFAKFDEGFLRKSLAFEKVILKNMRHRILDVGSMYVTSEDKVIPNLTECLRRAGIEDVVSHCAVDDARCVALAALSAWNIS